MGSTPTNVTIRSADSTHIYIDYPQLLKKTTVDALKKGDGPDQNVEIVVRETVTDSKTKEESQRISLKVPLGNPDTWSSTLGKPTSLTALKEVSRFADTLDQWLWLQGDSSTLGKPADLDPQKYGDTWTPDFAGRVFRLRDLANMKLREEDPNYQPSEIYSTGQAAAAASTGGPQGSASPGGLGPIPTSR